MNDALKDYEAVCLIHTDDYAMVYRGHKSHAIAGQSEEVLIYQWVNPHLFSEDCKKREEMYVITSTKSPSLARLYAYNFKSGRYVYESFSCSLAEHERFLEDSSPVWEQTWHDAVIGLYDLHKNYLNHGNITDNNLYFKKDGQLKFGGIFPNFNDDFRYNTTTAPAEGKNFLEREFQKDIASLCGLFLKEPYRHLIPSDDLDDIARLAKGEISLETARQNAIARFKATEKEREAREIAARERALYEQALAQKKKRKTPGFLFVSTLCVLAVLLVIGIKFALDKAKTPIKPLPGGNSHISGKEWDTNLRNEADKAEHTFGTITTPTVFPGNEIPVELATPPELTEAPKIEIFVGRAVYIMGPQIDVFNPNLQKRMSFIMDDDTKIFYADGTQRRQTEIKLGQEIELEYEPGKENEKAYIHIIRLQE